MQLENKQNAEPKK